MNATRDVLLSATEVARQQERIRGTAVALRAIAEHVMVCEDLPDTMTRAQVRDFLVDQARAGEMLAADAPRITALVEQIAAELLAEPPAPEQGTGGYL